MSNILALDVLTKWSVCVLVWMVSMQQILGNKSSSVAIRIAVAMKVIEQYIYIFHIQVSRFREEYSIFVVNFHFSMHWTFTT